MHSATWEPEQIHMGFLVALPSHNLPLIHLPYKDPLGSKCLHSSGGWHLQPSLLEQKGSQGRDPSSSL